MKVLVRVRVERAWALLGAPAAQPDDGEMGEAGVVPETIPDLRADRIELVGAE